MIEIATDATYYGRRRYWDSIRRAPSGQRGGKSFTGDLSFTDDLVVDNRRFWRGAIPTSLFLAMVAGGVLLDGGLVGAPGVLAVRSVGYGFKSREEEISPCGQR